MKYSAIALPVVFLMDILVIIFFNNYRQEKLFSQQQYQQDIIINYAVDAALCLAMTEATDSATDYRAIYHVDINPELALQAYTECMVKSLGWGYTEENIEYLIDQCTPYFLVVEPDGYYMYRQVKSDVITTLYNGRQIHNEVLCNEWTPKLPFVHEPISGESPDPDYIYIYSLEGDFYTRFNKSTKAFEKYVDLIDGSGPGSKNDKYVTIRNTLSANINQAITAKYNDSLKKYYNVLVSSNDGLQSISRPGIFSMYVNPDVLGKEPVIVVGGTQVEIYAGYIAYTVNGNKYYTYTRNRAAVEAKGYVIDKIFTNAVDAVLNGYYPDVSMN